MNQYSPVPGGPDWVDPDAPTGLAPQQPRPRTGGWQPPPGPPPSPPSGPPPHTAPPWPRHAGQASAPGPWPQHRPTNPHTAPQPPWYGPGAPYGAAPGPSGPPPVKTNKKLLIGLAAAAVVAVVAVVAIVAYSGGSGGGSGNGTSADTSATGIAKAYLEALSNGDAAKALSYGSAQPASTDLLTDDILRKQLAKMPISNIRILDEDTSMASIGSSSVHVAVNFGQTVDDVKLDLKQDANKNWKLETAVIKLDPPLGSDMDKGAATLTVFGKNFKNGSLYVFPGYQEVGSTSDWVTATAEPLLLDDLHSYTSASLRPTLTLNDDGRKAINDQLAASFARCQGSNLLAPPGCPTKLGFSDAVDGTVTWGPADLSGVKIGDLFSINMTALITGAAAIPISYRTTAGNTEQGTAKAYMAGNADLTQSPPGLSFN